MSDNLVQIIDGNNHENLTMIIIFFFNAFFFVEVVLKVQIFRMFNHKQQDFGMNMNTVLQEYLITVFHTWQEFLVKKKTGKRQLQTILKVNLLSRNKLGLPSNWLFSMKSLTALMTLVASSSKRSWLVALIWSKHSLAPSRLPLVQYTASSWAHQPVVRFCFNSSTHAYNISKYGISGSQNRWFDPLVWYCFPQT